MFGATVSVPLLFGPAMGMSPAEIARLISAVMLCSGVATLLQTTIGSRLPIVQGVSFSFLGAFFLIIGAASAEAAEAGVAAGPLAMRYIAGAIIAGALVEIVIGYSGLIGVLRRLLSPVVIGPVIMLIGLALFMHGAPKAGTHWPISGLTILLIIVVLAGALAHEEVLQAVPDPHRRRRSDAAVLRAVQGRRLSRKGTRPTST